VTVHLTRVKARMSIHAHRKVHGLLEGEYAALHAGRSMDFNDLREYVRGDDVKDLDWKASARTGSLLVKRYAALRQHTIQLVVSTGRSMAGLSQVEDSGEVSKRDVAVMLAGMVGALAVRHGDLVGLCWGDAEAQHQHRPTPGELGLERHLEAIHDAAVPSAGASDLAVLLDYVVRTIRRRTLLFVISDTWQVDEATAVLLRRLRVQHEVLFLTVGGIDPTAEVLAGRDLMDLDDGDLLPEWISDPVLRREYAEALAADAAAMNRRLDQLGIVRAHVPDQAAALRCVFELLESHRHARGR